MEGRRGRGRGCNRKVPIEEAKHHERRFMIEEVEHRETDLVPDDLFLATT